MVLMHYGKPITHSQQTKPQQSINSLALLSLAFRPFFLLATLCSLMSVIVWALWLNGYVSTISVLSPTIFHTHEMIFGFAATVAVGFLLTAVQTWTGKSSLQGLTLVPLILLWLGVRISLYINSDSGVLIATVLQSLWWLFAIIAFARLVISARNTRNLVLIPIMAALMLLNISVLWFDAQGFGDISLHLSRTAVLMFCVLMSVIGGRVIPFFTNSGTGKPLAKSSFLLSTLSITATLLSATTFFIERWIELPVPPAMLMLLAGLAHLGRMSRWGWPHTLKNSLLWSLHLSYLFAGLGLIAAGASHYLPSLRLGDALHLITLGAIGLMIFSMMSRVSLGHTGRKLKATKAITGLLYIVAAATFARFLLPVFSYPLIGWNLSAVLWVIGCAIFLWVYFPILLSPRLERV